MKEYETIRIEKAKLIDTDSRFWIYNSDERLGRVRYLESSNEFYFEGKEDAAIFYDQLLEIADFIKNHAGKETT